MPPQKIKQRRYTVKRETDPVKLAGIKKKIHQNKIKEELRKKEDEELKKKAENEKQENEAKAQEEQQPEDEQTDPAEKLNFLETKLEDLNQQKHKLFLLLKTIIAEDEKKKQAELAEKRRLEALKAQQQQTQQIPQITIQPQIAIQPTMIRTLPIGLTSPHSQGTPKLIPSDMKPDSYHPGYIRKPPGYPPSMAPNQVPSPSPQRNYGYGPPMGTSGYVHTENSMTGPLPGFPIPQQQQMMIHPVHGMVPLPLYPQLALQAQMQLQQAHLGLLPHPFPMPPPHGMVPSRPGLLSTPRGTNVEVPRRDNRSPYW